MKLTTLKEKATGRIRWGVVRLKGEIPTFVDLTGYLPDVPDLKSALGSLDRVSDAAARVHTAEPMIGYNYLPVIPNANKILGAGLNYRGHVLETGLPVTDHPMIFGRYPDSLVGHEQPLVRPKNSDQFDYEGELAFIVGKRARHVDAASAIEYIAGFTCFNDGSIRNFQWHTSQVFPGKNFANSGSCGPWLVTRDEIPEVGACVLTTRLNGVVRQHERLSDLIFDVSFLLAYLSSMMELLPGDVVATGTPGGVGSRHKPPLWMKPGDKVEVEISGIGILSNSVVAEERVLIKQAP